MGFTNKALREDIAYLTSHNLAVFALAANAKVPCKGSHGHKEAVTDPKEARALFDRLPQNVNIGIATGSPSGIVVVDIDVKDGQPGKASFAKLQRRLGTLTNTASVRSPTGSEHYYYRYDGSDIRNSASVIAPAIDIRGDGGYIAAPHSSIHGGRYEWVKKLSALRELPAALRELLVSDHAEAAKASNSVLTGDIPESQRNSSLTSIAGSMRSRGAEAPEMLGALEYINRQKCKPPLSATELKGIVKSVCRYEKGSQPAASEPFDLAKHFEPVSKMLRRDIEPVRYLLDGLLARGATSILGGPPKGLKSTLALWFALVLVEAIESDWENFKPVAGESRRVGYLDLEQADPLFKERLEQFKPDEVRRLFRVNKFPPFNAEGVAKLEQMIVDKRLDYVVVDTAARIRDPKPSQRGNAGEIDAALLDPVTKVAHSTGCHIQIVVQNGKRKDKDNPLEMLAATNQLAAAVDDVLVLFKPDNAEHELRRNLFITGRHIRSPGTYLIDRTDSGFQFLGDAAEALQGQLQKDVLAVLQSDHGKQGPLSPLGIAGVLGKERVAIQKVLAKLVDRQLITTAEGKYSSLANAMKWLKR